jgi:hypothetical protein
MRPTTVTVPDHVGQLFFDQGGKLIYWIHPERTTPDPTFLPNYVVYRYDIGSDRLHKVVQLPKRFLPAGFPSESALVGSRLGIVGWTIPEAPSASSPAQVLVVDLAADRIAASFRLSRMRAGQVKEEASAAEDPYRNIRPGIAWDVPRSRLFLVDAVRDEIAVIDLASASLRGPFEIRVRRTFVDRLLDLISVPAAAKMQASTQRRAVVSPDGRRLFLTGLRSDVVGTPAREQVTPLGLQVVDTTDWTEVARADITANVLVFPPDGRPLMAVTNRFEPRSDGWAERTDYALRIIDAERLVDIASVRIEPYGRIPGFALEGDAYLIAGGISSGSTTARRISVRDGRVVATRTIDQHFADLIVIAR